MSALFPIFSRFRLLFWGAAIFTALDGLLWAQSNPAPQMLPYSESFGAGTFAVLPAGLAAWNGLNGVAVNSAGNAAASAPTGDATVSTATTPQSTGGCYGYATAGNARFYIQTSSSTTNGANELALALNTSGQTAITLDYDVEIVSAQPRTVGVLCQYRVGATGGWTTLTPGSGSNPYSQSAGTIGVKTSPHFALPIAAENQPVVQIRWAVWRGTEAGSSSGVAIDNLVVQGVTASTTLSAAIFPQNIAETAGANAATLTVTRTGDVTLALPVLLTISDATEVAYDGPNPLQIPAGQSSVSFSLRAVDDDDPDGTQTVALQVTAPGAISAAATLSVLDDEDVNSPPAGYYSAVTDLYGTALKNALKSIASPANYHAYAYADTSNPLRALWEDPNNSANLITIYSGTSLAKSASYYPGGPSPDVSWSREHVWPESFGLDPDNVNPGSTGGDAGPDFIDLFNLRPCLQTVNNQRSNNFYDTTSGTPFIPALAPQCSRDGDSWEPREVEKGELARTIFYMATRYDGTDAKTIDLEIANTPNTALGRFANLATLLRWNDACPVTIEERKRNQTIFATYQRNRNPFIDHPEYVDRVWGHVQIEKLAATVAEGGVSDSYTIALGSQPTADVTVTLSALPAGQITLSPSSLTFTAANWNQPQTVTIAAINDNVYESTITVQVRHGVSSADSRYAALIPLDLTTRVTDDDPLIAPATLPISFGGPWDNLPTGFLGSNLGSPYASSLGGDAAPGSAKFDNAGDQLTIAFNSAPATLSYQLKGNPSAGTATSGSFVIQQSPDGTNFSTVRTVTNKDNSDQAFSDLLALNTRYVAFLYADKGTGNVQLDKIVITAAPAFQAWAFGFGLSGANAAALADPEQDGSVNLVEYALGSSPIVADSSTVLPIVQTMTGKPRVTAVVRTSDSALHFVAQTTTQLTDAQSWTVAGVTAVSPVDQTGVPSGFTRVAYEVPTTGEARFLRLRFSLD